MLRRLIVLALLTLASFSGMPAIGQEVAIPPELESWRDWVLQDDAHRRCPFLATQPATERDSFRCAWPERLTLSLGAQGGTFTQRWQIYSQSWVRLPGSNEHWPQQVRVNGQPAALVARDGAPSLKLAPGSHVVSGRLSWSTRPEALPIDVRTAMIDLTLDGARVAQPERPDGSVWLGKRRSAEQPARMEIQVYRLLHDEVPARLVTLLQLQVSGEGREELLARVLPEGFTPLSLESVLAARLEPDGRLRVQVRPGSWQITLTARGANVATQVTRPQSDGLWARDEVWSFAGSDRLRVASAQGVEGIDPVQANVPEAWRRYPAFRMPEGATLTVTERGRGLENADDNRLTLFREIWLDFDHRALTAIDTITGDMRRQWRLEMNEPFRLENARSGADTLLVTRNPGGGGSGIEVRTPDLNLTAVARTLRSRGELPATGWDARFEQVSGVLHLPPGHRLLAAPGADSAPQAWLDRWGLWDLFGVLVVSVFAGWLAGRPVGVVAFVALLLTYQEAPETIWLWVNVLAAAAVARAAPEGRLRNFARVYRALAFGVLALVLLPFLWGQARLALHPQLEYSYASAVRGEPGVVVTGNRESRPAQAPAPMVALDESSAPPASEEERDAAISDSVRRGLNQAQAVRRYAPGTLLQTGPGVPAWHYQNYAYSWSGPVEPDQTVRFVYIGPIVLGLWRFLGIALVVALFAALLQTTGPAKWDGKWVRDALARGFRRREASAAVALLVLALGCGAGGADAAETPDPALLTELKNRLLRAPDCAPVCADITSARVSVRGDRLEVTLEISALATVAVPVPGANDRWQLDTVTLDGRSALAVGREGDGTLWVPVTPGVREVRLEGSLARAESIQLAFPTVPKHISVSSDGWDVTGLNEGRLLAGSLELVRRRSTADATTALETSSEFPPFVHVTRDFDLGLDWSVTTTVRRVAPQRAALNVQVPLVAGESVLSEGAEVREQGAERVALVGLERGQAQAQWSSGLARAETLELSMPANAARAETWTFVVSPQWNVEFAGVPAVLPTSLDQVWTYEFHPRPGEKLSLRITRPQRAEGGTLAIDAVEHSVWVGVRSRDVLLQFRYRSTQGGRHGLGLPPEARVTRVQLDGQAVQLRPNQGELSIGLLPGEHSVSIAWTEPLGATFRVTPSAVDLRTTASNVSTRIELPERRWPLFVSGSGVGPAVLYWAELVVFIVTAVLLGRWSQSPLRTHEWLLLGFGLSTLSWLVLAIVAAWLFAVRWRELWQGEVGRLQFNAVQLLLAVLTVIAVGSLVFSGIRQSLLASPDMGIAGPGSGGNGFAWFLDKTDSTLPRPQVFSAPMWSYRALMFAWALWIVLALLRWLRWTWRAWHTNGMWRGKKVVQ